jgi:hypothetical protein
MKLEAQRCRGDRDAEATEAIETIEAVEAIEATNPI